MRERELQLVGRIVVGRDPACEISHDDSLLSRRHAEFVTVGNAVTVRDLGSRNGVFVNGTRAAEHLLEPGDIVQIGPLRARFVVEHLPSGISPEELDVERTAVLRKGAAVVPPAAAQVRPAAPISASVPAAVAQVRSPVPALDSDDEVTRLVPAPRMPTPVPRMMTPPPVQLDPPAAPPVDSDDEETEFIAGPDASHLRATAAPAASAPPLYVPPRSRQPVAPATVDRDLRTFVYVQLATLAAAILAAAALPVAMWRRAALDGPAAAGASVSLVWLALPVAVALIGTYFVGASINRRVTGALAAGERNRT